MAAIRREVPAEVRGAATVAITRHMLALPEYARAARVVAYVALGDEVSIAAIAAAVLAGGRGLLLPRVAGDHLEFAAVRDLTDLRIGRFGIAEPAPDLSCERLASTDFVLVPGIAFDANGGRLGRGAGFYDRSLPRGAGAPLAFGVGFACQLVDAVPMGPHDRCLDGVVTERGVVR